MSLESLIKEHDDRIAGLEELVALSFRLLTVNMNVTTNESQRNAINNLRRRMRRMKSQEQTLVNSNSISAESRIEDHETRITELKELVAISFRLMRMGSPEQTVVNSISRSAALESRIADHETRIAELEELVPSVFRFATLETRIADNESRIAEHETRIFELEDEVGKNAAKNEDQENKIANLMKRIKQLEEKKPVWNLRT